MLEVILDEVAFGRGLGWGMVRKVRGVFADGAGELGIARFLLRRVVEGRVLAAGERAVEATGAGVSGVHKLIICRTKIYNLA